MIRGCLGVVGPVHGRSAGHSQGDPSGPGRSARGGAYGGEAPRNYVGIEVTGWERIGNYAIRFEFSDGHRTGLYSYELLRQLGETPKA